MYGYNCSSGRDWHRFRVELVCEECDREEDTTIKRRCRCNDRWLHPDSTTLKNDGIVICIKCETAVYKLFFCCQPGRVSQKSKPARFTRKALTIKVTNWDS